MTQGREGSQEWVCMLGLVTTVGASSSGEDWKSAENRVILQER